MEFSTKSNEYNKMKKLLLTIWVLLLPFQAISNVDAKKETLETILQKTAAYCKRLKTVAFRFVCYEKVVEIFDQETRYYSLVFRVSPKRKVIKNEYINDYGILKMGNQIKEHRKLIKHNGKNISPKNKDLQSVIYSYKGALSPIYLFSMENQSKFIYNLLGEKKVLGQPAFEIEVKYIKGDKKEPVAIVWIDKLDFSVLKFKVLKNAFKGYELIIKTDNKQDKRIKLNDTHYFGYKRKGLRFPSKTEISVITDKYSKKVSKNKSHFFLL